MYTDPLEHLEAELKRLDLLLHREILRLRAAYALSLDEFRGLYISDEQVDRLAGQALGEQQPDLDVAALTDRAETLRLQHRDLLAEDLPWNRLVTTFDLSSFEQDVVLVALAPEVDLKYETLYAYLNNDVTRKAPTFDLALRLFAGKGEDRSRLRRALLQGGTLFGSGILRRLRPSTEHPSWLATGFTAAPGTVCSILGLNVWDEQLADFAVHETPVTEWDDLPLSLDLAGALRRTTEHFGKSGATWPVLVFAGRFGTGRLEAGRAVCRALGLPLMRIDLEALGAAVDASPEVVQALRVQRRLQPTGIYAEGIDRLFDKDGRPLPGSRRALDHVTSGPGPIIVPCAPDLPWRDLLGRIRCLVLPFDEPGRDERRRLWSRCLLEYGRSAPAEALDLLADRFVLNPGQINQVAAAACDAQHLKAHPAEPLAVETLFEAARAESGRRLGRLATRVRLLHTWDDLVLPPATQRRVKEIAAAVRHRHQVYGVWGFEKRIGTGKGLKVLFAGTPGTGKTMTAGVIARDLGLDLYKIDLSGVVSKYIGETEKNLDRIFRAAHASNAILFFDEADALFGKRSEVKDAHDRYANIEISYLLQKMEEYEGAVILATNLRKNIDEAFSRRMHYAVEFPVPDEHHRERLWRGMFPPSVPLGADVDLGFLARQFTLSGGDIQNVALDAAFLAAENGQVVTMKQLVNAVARQLTKEGRLASPTDFKHYHALLRSDS